MNLAKDLGKDLTTMGQIYIFGKTNNLCLEDSIIKLIENGDLKPKIKTALSQLIKMIHKNKLGQHV